MKTYSSNPNGANGITTPKIRRNKIIKRRVASQQPSPANTETEPSATPVEHKPKAKRIGKPKGMMKNKKPVGSTLKHHRPSRKPKFLRKGRVPFVRLPISELSADNLPGVNGKEAKSLWECQTVEAVEVLTQSWNQTFRRKVLGAIKRRKIPERLRACIYGLFDGTTTSSTIITNEKILWDGWHYLHSELVALAEQDADFEVAFVTIIDGDSATSHAKPIVNLFASQVRCQTTLRAMSPHYFAITESVLFNSMSHSDGGQLVQPHTHALVFGAGALDKAREVGAKHMSRFAPNATDAPQIVVRKVNTHPVNLARICAYMFKSPHRCKTWCPPRDGKKGHMHQSEKGDRKIRYLRMAMIRAMLTVEDVTFAGGEGHRIRSQIIKMARPRCAAEAPPHRRLLHPDEVGAFCVELAKALGKTPWTLPVIKRQK